MKGKLTAGALALSTLFAASTAFAASNTIHFRGEILENTCNVTPATSEQWVEMGKINKSEFVGGVGGTSPVSKNFTISLENCPDTYTKAAVRFGGTTDADSDGDLAIGSGNAPINETTSGGHTGDFTGTDADGNAITPAVAATGIAIRIFNADGSRVKLYDDSQAATIANGKADLNFSATYIQTAANITAGTGNADSQFTVTYAK